MKKKELIKEIGKKIRHIRAQKHLTIQYVAKTAKISKSMLRGLETSRYISLPSFKILKRIADVLGIRRKRLTFPITQEMGTRIRNLRIAHKQSEKNVAIDLHVSSDVISRWERGQVKIKGSWIVYIARYYHVQPYYLRCRTDIKDINTGKEKGSKSISLFPHNAEADKGPELVNPLQISLDDAIDKSIPVSYHGVKLNPSHWNICCRLIQDWCN